MRGSIYRGRSNVGALLQMDIMDVFFKKMLPCYSLAGSGTVMCGLSVVSQDILFLNYGLRDVRLFITLFLTAIIYYNFYVQVKEALIYSSSIEIMSELERYGPSAVRNHNEWSVIIRCGSSEGRSHILSMIFLLLYDNTCNLGTYFPSHWAGLFKICMWCGGGYNLRPSWQMYLVWRCYSAMAASCAL